VLCASNVISKWEGAEEAEEEVEEVDEAMLLIGFVSAPPPQAISRE
jgi:hypothetical protein